MVYTLIYATATLLTWKSKDQIMDPGHCIGVAAMMIKDKLRIKYVKRKLNMIKCYVFEKHVFSTL
jgi:hypothetical protein